MPNFTEKEYKALSIGTHLGVLYQFIDYGTQIIRDRNGEPKKTESGKVEQHPQVRFTFEVPGELTDEGKPMSAGKTVNAYLSDQANLVKLIKSWTGERISKTYDFSKLLGRGALLTMNSGDGGDGKTYSYIGGVAPLVKGMETPKLINKPVYFDLAKFDKGVFESLNEKTKLKIVASPEYGWAIHGKPEPKKDADLDDSIPF